MSDKKCSQHHNLADILCLQPQCSSRLICYLCQHNHQLFPNIRKITKTKYQQFRKKVDKEIDYSINLIKDQGVKGTDTLIKMINNYYENIRQNLNELIENKRKENVKILSSSQSTDMGLFVKARIESKYYQLQPEMFKKIKEVYQGKDLQTLARQQQEKNIQTAHAYMESFNRQMTALLDNFDIKLSIKVPEIRLISQQQQNQQNKINIQGYDEQMPRSKLKCQLVSTSQKIQFQSIISDCHFSKKQILVTSYDKSLTILDKTYQQMKKLQFQNILMKIQALEDNIYAIGISKQIQVAKIAKQNNYELQHIMWLRGHTQKISDLHSYNTRILGSCSDQGLKIWDLYKQKCEYTLKQKINPSCFNFGKKQKNLMVGYHDHVMKIYSIENMKTSRSYDLQGVALYISQESRQENIIYLGGFNSIFMMFDIRLPKQVMKYNFKSEAVSFFKESIFEQDTMFIGERGGKARIFDLKKQKLRGEWDAHMKMTNLSKPNGIVSIYEEAPREIKTVGCNDRKLATWRLING